MLIGNLWVMQMVLLYLVLLYQVRVLIYIINNEDVGSIQGGDSGIERAVSHVALLLSGAYVIECAQCAQLI